VITEGMRWAHDPEAWGHVFDLVGWPFVAKMAVAAVVLMMIVWCSVRRR
jgi:hypothetical protein